MRLLYNSSGEKVALAGTNGLDDVVEEPRGTFDVVLHRAMKALRKAWPAVA